MGTKWVVDREAAKYSAMHNSKFLESHLSITKNYSSPNLNGAKFKKARSKCSTDKNN